MITAQDVFELLQRHDGLTTAEVAEDLGLSPFEAAGLLVSLEDHNKVYLAKVKRGRKSLSVWKVLKHGGYAA